MSNLYENEIYNIVSVHKGPTESIFDESANIDVDGNFITIILQRLPVSNYPLTTEVTISSLQVSPDLEFSAWVANSLPLINSALLQYDSTFDNTPPDSNTPIETFTEIFNT